MRKNQQRLKKLLDQLRNNKGKQQLSKRADDILKLIRSRNPSERTTLDLIREELDRIENTETGIVERRHAIWDIKWMVDMLEIAPEEVKTREHSRYWKKVNGETNGSSK